MSKKPRRQVIGSKGGAVGTGSQTAGKKTSSARRAGAMWLRFLGIVDGQWKRHQAFATAGALMASVLLIGSLGGNSNGGDTRGLADLAWWIAGSGHFHLTEHPAYLADVEWFGYWAVRNPDGKVLSVYPPATAAIGAAGFGLLSAFGVVFDANSVGVGAILVATMMMAIAAISVWLVVLRQEGAIPALFCTVLFLFGTLVGPFIAKGLWTQTGGLFSQSLAIIAGLRVIQGSHRRESVTDGILLVLCGAAACWAYFCRPTFLFWSVPFGLFLLLRLGWEIWKPASGALGAAVFGFWLNAVASGSWRGAYAEKVSNQAGFVFDPFTVWHQGMAILFSPGRGLLLFSPWVVLAMFGVVLATSRRFRGRAFLLVNIIFVVAVLGLVASFRMWHGGWSPGPRLQTDCVLSAAIVAGPAVRWLLIRLWGIPLLAAVAAPSLDTNLRVAPMTSHFPDAYIANYDQEIGTWTWDWEKSAYRWYRTGASAQRALKGINLEPLMSTAVVSAREPQAIRFEGRGMELDQEKGVFVPLQREAEIVFAFPPRTDLPDPLLLVVNLEPAGANWGDVRHLEFRLNEAVWTRRFIAEVHEPVVYLELSRDILRAEGVNSFLIIDRRPIPRSLGKLYLGVRSLEFFLLSPEERQKIGEELLRPKQWPRKTARKRAPE